MDVVREHLVPQTIINPTHVDEVHMIINGNNHVWIKLKSGVKHELWRITYEAFSEMMDTAMRERDGNVVERVAHVEKKPLCVCGHDYNSHGDHGSGGGCRASSGAYSQCRCPKWERA